MEWSLANPRLIASSVEDVRDRGGHVGTAEAVTEILEYLHLRDSDMSVTI